MRSALTTLLSLALLSACENRRADTETGATDGARTGVDTVITTQRVQDTTIVRADTSIDVDTVKRTDHIKENR